MTVYTAISKQLGWTARVVTIPNITEAANLLSLVKKQDAYAFKKVFLVHRFAPNGVTEAHSEAMKIILEAFVVGQAIFNAIEAK